jgi:hypothetical protein
VDLVRTDVSEESVVSIIVVKRISDLGKTLATTNNRIMLRRNELSGFSQDPHDVTSQKTAFFILVRYLHSSGTGQRGEGLESITAIA